MYEYSFYQYEYNMYNILQPFSAGPLPDINPVKP